MYDNKTLSGSGWKIMVEMKHGRMKQDRRDKTGVNGAQKRE